MANNRSLWIITAVITIMMSAGILLIVQLATADQTSNQTSNTTTNITVTKAATEEMKTYNVTINNFTFSPKTLIIKKGDTVIWTNLETVPHIVTSYNATLSAIYSTTNLKSPRLSQGQTFIYVFDQRGDFSYRCDIHPAMKGTISVK